MSSENILKTIPNQRTNNNKIDAFAFYKLLVTLSNMHSTVESFYDSIGETSQANYHNQLSMKILNEANTIKNLKLNKSKE